MKRLLIIGAALAATLTLAGQSALAFHCPLDMKKIDAALAAGAQVSADRMAAVKELRAAGEALHKKGQHHAAVAVLAEAMKILGIK
ncbi:MAG: hypothetical protein D6826_08410 [Alphaproteobacteria bacterium]|nr:MAG: hypothetical protein D6826_08410 [Alphaproteobacteria bacterium]